MALPLIFQEFKELRENIPWISLGNFPTPVERPENLCQELGVSNLWIKRDDLSGEFYGGNKVRTLEFSLAEAQRKRANRVFTYSALGSNWPLACVIYAKLRGLPTDVFFLPYPLDAVKRRNLDATYQLARRVHSARSVLTFPFLLGFNLFKVRKRARVYLTPPGGVSPLTTLGYVNAVLELRNQVQDGEMPMPDTIFCPFGSGGTAAGISIGLHLVGWPTKVVAVRVVDHIVANKWVLKHLISKTVQSMKKNGVDVSDAAMWGENIKIEHGYFGDGYSRPLPSGEKSIELFRTCENQILDSTYTGKTCAALLDACKKDEFRNKTLLFWHTLNSRNLDRVPEKLGTPDRKKEPYAIKQSA